MIASLSSLGILRLEVGDVTWSVRRLNRFLSEIRNSYAMLLSFLPSLEEKATIDDRSFLNRGTHFSFLYPWGIVRTQTSDGRSVTYPEIINEAIRQNPRSYPGLFAKKLSIGDEPVINSISISSPGWVEIIGRLNPIQGIHDILTLVRDWREMKNRATLQNKILEIEGLRLRMQMLLEAGFADPEIQQMVSIWLTPPTGMLIEMTESKRVTDSKVLPFPAPGIAAENSQ